MSSLPLSFKNFFERQDTGALRADQPLDAGAAWTLIDNVGHMVDECGKYRINWLGTLWSEGDHYAVSTSIDRMLPVWFPTQVILATQYPCYDVRVAINADAAYPIRVSLVTPFTQVPITGLDAGVIGTFTGITVIGSTWIEGLMDTRRTEDAPPYILDAPTSSGFVAVVGRQVLVKLLIEGLVAGTSVMGIQVREFSR